MGYWAQFAKSRFGSISQFWIFCTSHLYRLLGKHWTFVELGRRYLVHFSLSFVLVPFRICLSCDPERLNCLRALFCDEFLLDSTLDNGEQAEENTVDVKRASKYWLKGSQA